MKRVLFTVSAIVLAAVSFSSLSCSRRNSNSGSASVTLNRDKPLVFFNRQPSDPYNWRY